MLFQLVLVSKKVVNVHEDQAVGDQSTIVRVDGADSKRWFV